MQIKRAEFTNLIIRREETARLKKYSIEKSVSKGRNFRKYQYNKEMRDKQYWMHKFYSICIAPSLSITTV